MKNIKIIDMTLRAPGNRKTALTFKEKLEIARISDKIRVDAIELAPIDGSKAETLANKTIASSVKTGLSAGIEIGHGMIDVTWESVKGAKSPSLNLITPVSTVQMEYSCHMKAPKMLDAIRNQIAACRELCDKVEFTAVDASRAESDFLIQAIAAAVESGANRVTVCDNAGVMLPDEFADFITKIKNDVPALAQAELYVEIENVMGMAMACASAAIKAGVDGVKCTATDHVYPTLAQAALLMNKKGIDLGISSNIVTTELNRSVNQIVRIINPASGSMVSGDLSAEESSVTLSEGDDITEMTKVVMLMGYDLSEEDLAKVYEEFQRVATKKHFVGTKELDAIIASTAMQVPSSYKLDNFVITSGNIITATANLLLEKNGEKLRGVGVGDGPVDAAFQAIEQIIGHHYELDDFQVQTVTEGRDAMGSAIVKLRADGKVYSGSGISTDIIGASIRAYISALNKIVYEEN